MSKIDETRDEILGAALAEIETPGHNEHFFTQLREAMTAEDEKPVPVHRSHRARHIASAATALVAASVAAVLILTSQTDDNHKSPVAQPPHGQSTTTTAPAPQQLDAALIRQVVDKATTKYETATSVRLNMTYTEVDPDKKAFITKKSIVRDDKGNELADWNDVTRKSRTIYAYDASSGIWSVKDNAEINHFLEPATSQLDEYSGAMASLRPLAEKPGATIENADLDGKQVWKITFQMSGYIQSFEPVKYIVWIDKNDDYIVASEQTNKDGTVYQTHVDAVTFDQAIPAADFRIAKQKGDAENALVAGGYKRTDIAHVSTLAGYSALGPSDLPDGYHLADVWYAEEVAGQDSSYKQIDLVYRRGLQEVRVTTSRLIKNDTGADPLIGEGLDPSVGVKLTGGSFNGKTAKRVDSYFANSHIFVKGTFTKATISGSLSPDELTAAMNSMTELH